jgi:AcrR family transcriptional regulator
MTGRRIPSGVALTWGVRPPRGRGPVPSLTVEDVAAASIAIADRDGLSAVTMEAVARALGCTKMALYRYVGAKDDLVALMFDGALGRPPARIARARGSRAGLKAWASHLRTRYLDHPWAIDLPLGGTVMTRNQTVWLEAALGAMSELALALPEKLNLVLLINGHVLFSAKVARDASTAGSSGPDQTSLASLASHDLPIVSEALRAGLLTDGIGGEVEFQWGLDCILRGIPSTGQRQ